MNAPRILIAGIGNIFMGDDAFGVEVAMRLSRREMPEGVRVVDFGIRGLDLAYALMEDYHTAILVDAMPRGGDPGSVYTLEIENNTAEDAPSGPVEIDPHGMNPMRVLEMVKSLGGRAGRVLVVGCEPQSLGDAEEGALGLSAPVEAAVEVTIDVLHRLVEKIGSEYRASVPAAAV
jgi:hydrogenase maturation protease